MANTRSYTRAFSGGVMSPEMFGRIDDVKFQTGAAKLRNFISMPQGPAENRPGFSYVRAVKDSTKRTRLIPFTYSTTQTMVIELGAGYVRFHTQGATLLAGSPNMVNESACIIIIILPIFSNYLDDDKAFWSVFCILIFFGIINGLI
jgi:hypothetical protein